MSNISQRQAKILAAIVKEYSQSGVPVGSLEMAGKYDFGVSPATIRNEMQILEREGFITQPHTSAGRVPTNEGYRYFVNKLMRHLELTQKEQKLLQQELFKMKQRYIELGRSLTRLLSEQSEGAAFALLPDSSSSSGLSNMIDENTDPEELREVAKFLDEVGDHKKELLDRAGNKVRTFIGKDSPVPLAKDYSMIVTRVLLPSGEKGVVGVIGSKRMRYEKNISLLEYISKLLSSGLGVFLVISNF